MKTKNINSGIKISFYGEDVVKALMILAFYDAEYGFCYKTRDVFAEEWNEAVRDSEIVWCGCDEDQPLLTYSRFIKPFGSFTNMKQILREVKWIA
jgi:hypothetical protein